MANSWFNYQFQLSAEVDQEFDDYTFPNLQNIRKDLQLEEVKRLYLFSQQIKGRMKKRRVITLAGDSTTRKGVGKYAMAGIQTGKDNLLPLHT